nr:cytochrome b5 domain-containing protein [Halalkalibacter oceani]
MILGSLGLVILLAACGGEEATDEGVETEEVETEEVETEGDQVFTLEELGEYDGQDGNDAYVAVDGVVYDVTNVEQWAGGEHAPAGGLVAGDDYTEEIEKAPHGTDVLEDLPIVGTLEE